MLLFILKIFNRISSRKQKRLAKLVTNFHAYNPLKIYHMCFTYFLRLRRRRRAGLKNTHKC